MIEKKKKKKKNMKERKKGKEKTKVSRDNLSCQERIWGTRIELKNLNWNDSNKDLFLQVNVINEAREVIIKYRVVWRLRFWYYFK